MNVWEIKLKIISITTKIAFEDNYFKRMELFDEILALNDILTAKIVKAQRKIKSQKKELEDYKIEN